MKHFKKMTIPLSVLFAFNLTALSCFHTILAAPPWEETHKLFAANGKEDDRFGSPIDTDGNLILVGVSNDSDIGFEAGAVYIFDFNTGQQLSKLYASDGASFDAFGSSISMDGNLALVGSPFDFNSNGFSAGSVYLFDISTDQQLLKMLPTDGYANNLFGISVSLSGNLAVIGDRGTDNGVYSGSAYIFDVSTGQQIVKLLPSDGAARDLFGTSVAISGNFAVIGASSNSNSNGTEAGAAYVFDATTGQQLLKLLPSDGLSYAHFGGAVAIEGNSVVIGQSGGGDNTNNFGIVYVFDINTGQQLLKLLASDGADYDNFGDSLSVSGNLALIGAYHDDDINSTNAGSAYLFDLTTGEQLFKYLPSVGAAYDRFGWSVAISGDRAAIGAPGNSELAKKSGSAYTFQVRPTNYLLTSPETLIPNQNGTFSMVEMLPTQETWLLYSIRGLQPTFISQLGITIDLAQPKIASGPDLTDAEGNLQIVERIPNISAPTKIWFQAVQEQNMTNFARTQIVP